MLIDYFGKCGGTGFDIVERVTYSPSVRYAIAAKYLLIDRDTFIGSDLAHTFCKSKCGRNA